MLTDHSFNWQVEETLAATASS